MTNRISWNTGLTKATSPILAATARKISRAKKGKSFPKEWRENISKGKKGKPHSLEHRKKIGLAHIGYRHTEEAKQKMRLAKLGEKSTFWRGGRIQGKDGYVFIYVRNHPRANYKGYVQEHRLVWERYHKRIIPRGFIIHHIDGNPANNKIENLQLMEKQKHLQYHKKPKQPKIDFHSQPLT